VPESAGIRGDRCTSRCCPGKGIRQDNAVKAMCLRRDM